MAWFLEVAFLHTFSVQGPCPSWVCLKMGIGPPIKSRRVSTCFCLKRPHQQTHEGIPKRRVVPFSFSCKSCKSKINTLTPFPKAIPSRVSLGPKNPRARVKRAPEGFWGIPELMFDQNPRRAQPKASELPGKIGPSVQNGLFGSRPVAPGRQNQRGPFEVGIPVLRRHFDGLFPAPKWSNLFFSSEQAISCSVDQRFQSATLPDALQKTVSGWLMFGWSQTLEVAHRLQMPCPAF